MKSCKTYDEFIQKVMVDDGIDYWFDFGKLSLLRVAQLKKSTGKDFSGYTRIITTSAVRHILKGHGSKSFEILKIAIEDFALIPIIK